MSSVGDAAPSLVCSLCDWKPKPDSKRPEQALKIHQSVKHGVREETAPAGMETPKPVPAGKRVLARQLAATFASVGLLVSAVDPTCGMSVLEQSEPIGEALAALAETNPKIRAALQRATQASAWGGVLIAVSPVVMTVLGHHLPRSTRSSAASSSSYQPLHSIPQQ